VIDHNKALLHDLNFQTALLESVDWDESQSAALLQYLTKVLSGTTVLPEDILKSILSEYGTAARDLIKKIFLDAYIENGLYMKSGDGYEH